MRYIDCKHHKDSNDILMSQPMMYGKSIMRGYCTKESELYYCDGDDCPYLRFQQEELEIRTILIGVAIYLQKITWDELGYGVNEMKKGFQEFTATLHEINSKFSEEASE